MTTLSLEFDLTAACCRWPPNRARDLLVRAKANGADWERLVRVARRQRVEGLVSDALARAKVSPPDQVASILRSAAGDIARQNLALALESRRVHRLLESGGVAHLFVKGATLDMLAYGSLGVKRTRDIDLLVEKQAALPAAELLQAAGYERIFPGPEVGPERFPRWIALCKETNWRHPASGTILELHTELVDNPALLAGVGVRSPTQLVELGPGVRLPTLSTDALYAYICVHGATHGWSRMKWIADVAALLSRFDPAGREDLHRTSEKLGAGRASSQALLLSRALFDIELPPKLLEELRRDRAGTWLARVALRVMGADGREAELDETIFGTLPIHLSHFALGSGWKHKFAELRRKLNNHDDQVHVALPEQLEFLYPVISLPRWFWRRIRGPSLKI